MHQKYTFGDQRAVKHPKYQNVRQPLRAFRNRLLTVMTILWFAGFSLYETSPVTITDPAAAD